MKTQLTKNLWRHEMVCKCGSCGFDTMDFETLNVVQDCCDYFADLLGISRVFCRVHSAARCLDYNRSVGSTDASQHTKARAIDFSLRNISPKTVHAYLIAKYPDKFGIGGYETFTHIDTRTGPAARW